MSLREFADAAGDAAAAMAAADRHDAIALACRGSGNPATLAWVAEALALDDGDRVVDIGGGLGGPSAWLSDHYGCRAVCADPVTSSLVAARSVLGLPAVACTGDALPFGDDTFDAALALGVISVVPDAGALLAEAHRIAGRLGILAYVSTGDTAVDRAGSRFPTRDELLVELAQNGWRVDADPVAPDLPAPPAWSDAADHDGGTEPDDDEQAVVDAIEGHAIEAIALTCLRRDPDEPA